MKNKKYKIIGLILLLFSISQYTLEFINPTSSIVYTWIFGPVLMLIILIIGVYMLLHDFNKEKTTGKPQNQ